MKNLTKREIRAKRICVVDASADVRMTLWLRLDQAGYTVEVIGNGEEAIRYLHSGNSPHLIVLDPNLPDINGWRIATVAQERGPIPVIFFTDLITPEKKAEAIDLYQADFMIKPIAYTELLARIRRILFPNYYGDLALPTRGTSKSLPRLKGREAKRLSC